MPHRQGYLGCSDAGAGAKLINHTIDAEWAAMTANGCCGTQRPAYTRQYGGLRHEIDLLMHLRTQIYLSWAIPRWSGLICT